MTDQTEPKYKIGQDVLDKQGRTHHILGIKKDGYSTNLTWHLDKTQILYSVAIHPIEHHKCKDCENAYALYQCYPEEKYYIHPCVKLSLLSNIYTDAEARMRKINDDDEPPPNCHCFTPKLSPDGKESR